MPSVVNLSKMLSTGKVIIKTVSSCEVMVTTKAVTSCSRYVIVPPLVDFDLMKVWGVKEIEGSNLKDVIRSGFLEIVLPKSSPPPPPQPDSPRAPVVVKPSPLPLPPLMESAPLKPPQVIEKIEVIEASPEEVFEEKLILDEPESLESEIGEDAEEDTPEKLGGQKDWRYEKKRKKREWKMQHEKDHSILIDEEKS